MILYNGEKIVFDRSYDSVLPKILMVFGGIIMALGGFMGLAILTETENAGLFVVSLLFGGLLLILGYYLKQNCVFRLMVTTKRVAQDGPFNQCVRLPLSHISGVTVKGDRLHVSAAGASIDVGIPDSVNVCEIIIGLLTQIQPEVEVQTSNAAPAPRQATPAPQSRTTQEKRKEEKTEFVFAEGEANPFAEDAEFVDVCCPKCKEPLSFVVGTKQGECPECGAVIDLRNDTVAPAAQPAKPAETEMDVTPYLGKKFCSGCGELIAAPNVTECPVCGSKYLGVITRTNASNIIPNIEKH